jgi:hypothetical protein
MINNTLAASRWQEMMGLSFIAQKSTSQNQYTMIYLLSLFVLIFGCSIFRVLYCRLVSIYYILHNIQSYSLYHCAGNKFALAKEMAGGS